MRLTKYEPNKESMFPYQLKDNEISTKLDSIHKLGQLEDIEEELGIDLITLFKALKNGIWIKYKRFCFDKEYIIEHYKPDDFIIGFQNDFANDYEAMFFRVRIYGDFEYGEANRDVEGDFEDTIYLSKNYGKTWALTKEELF